MQANLLQLYAYMHNEGILNTYERLNAELVHKVEQRGLYSPMLLTPAKISAPLGVGLAEPSFPTLTTPSELFDEIEVATLVIM